MLVVGVLSGTSVDGVDCALVEITGTSSMPKIIAFKTYKWPSELKERVTALIAGQQVTSAEVCRANFDVGVLFGRTVKKFLQDVNIPRDKVAIVGSHGQTIWHDVQNGTVSSTLQIGEAACIVEATGITTVSNFRTADVALGGHGAPLVSVFDWHFLRPKATQGSSTWRWRAVQNIGGIGNVTLLSPGSCSASSSSSPTAQDVMSFDTGPGNCLIDWAANKLSDGKMAMDEDGKLAASGKVCLPLLEDILSHPYFRQKPPKSTGRELFSEQFADRYWRKGLEEHKVSAEDVVATFTAATARSIAQAILTFLPAEAELGDVVVAGGGAQNPTLMKWLKFELNSSGHYLYGSTSEPQATSVSVCTHKDLGVDGDSKEAVLFAYLAYLCVRGLPGNVPACTHASRPAVLGQISPGLNFASLLQA